MPGGGQGYLYQGAWAVGSRVTNGEHDEFVCVCDMHDFAKADSALTVFALADFSRSTQSV
jgi:hypothetical protein